MPETVDGPSTAAFDTPNAIQIARLQKQIIELANALNATTDERKKKIHADQIRQLELQQAILFRQMSVAASAAPFDPTRRDPPFESKKVKPLIEKERDRLRTTPSSGPVTGKKGPDNASAPLEALANELDTLANLL